MSNKRGIKHIWMIEDVAATPTREAKSYWTRIGVAFENRDGSWKLELSAMPIHGRLHMRDPQPREGRDPATFVPELIPATRPRGAQDSASPEERFSEASAIRPGVAA